MSLRLDRLELKFLVRSSQRERLLRCLRGRLDGDPNLAGRADYPVTTLYFDSADLCCYLERVRESANRRKLRLRIYGSPRDSIEPATFLEIKHNQEGRVAKRRVALPPELVRRFEKHLDPDMLFGVETNSDRPGERAVLREARAMVAARGLRPLCLVRYDRLALQGRAAEAGLRITFDSNVRCRSNLSGPWFADAREEPLLEGRLHLLEVKANGALPCWLTRLLAEEKCGLRSFSKFCRAVESQRKHQLATHA